MFKVTLFNFSHFGHYTNTVPKCSHMIGTYYDFLVCGNCLSNEDVKRISSGLFGKSYIKQLWLLCFRLETLKISSVLQLGLQFCRWECQPSAPGP
jgi:hypothetical protein